MHTLKKVVLAWLCITLSSGLAYAGRSCEAKWPDARTVERGLQLAERTRAELEQSGAKVVVLARAGQDLSRYQLRYSHLGFAYKAADGRWLVLHKLNHCGTGEATVYRQGLGEFFLDDLFRYQAAWIAPSSEVQAALHAAITSPAATAMHHKRYNMLAYPWSQRYQQSNQWALETLAAAMDSGITSRVQAQAWLRLKRFEPSTLHLGPLTRLGGRMTSANIAFDDHPNEKRFSDRIETTTVDSVMRWLTQSGLGGPLKELSL